jgi:hypothetical protein
MRNSFFKNLFPYFYHLFAAYSLFSRARFGHFLALIRHSLYRGADGEEDGDVNFASRTPRKLRVSVYILYPEVSGRAAGRD